MLASIINFTSLLLGALLVGTMFGIWLGYNPTGYSASVYVSQQQHVIAALNVTLPLMGAATIVLTLVAAGLSHDRTRMVLLVVAAIAFVVAGLITRFRNQPINAEVMTWIADAPPSNWAQLRDQWWHWHVVRLCAGIGGLSLLIAAALHRTPRPF